MRNYEFVAPGGMLRFSKVESLICNAVPAILTAAITKSVTALVEPVQ